MKCVFHRRVAAGMVGVLLAVVSVGSGAPGVVYAAPAPAPANSGIQPKDYVCIALPPLPGLGKCSAEEGGGLKLNNSKAQGGAIVEYLRALLKLLSEAVSVVVVMMLVIAGVQYITSTGDAARVKAAKDRLQNAIIALVLFLSMFAILSFLIPGGIL